jgi:hypothetical protein
VDLLNVIREIFARLAVYQAHLTVHVMTTFCGNYTQQTALLANKNPASLSAGRVQA